LKRAENQPRYQDEMLADVSDASIAPSLAISGGLGSRQERTSAASTVSSVSANCRPQRLFRIAAT
jgi:hypothetical protein